ncbi:hypothetical protein [Novacetimonas maltaceti]|uniref:Cysteine rich repeat protein n=1 Tax=Novacetimonas maltaceti TaxID=1203393 RepID=A0A2S3W2X3_9PROT|nr:hypothetical protein [Novacetimonas maltaceti]POF63220.1 hypothetical protein KMAL_11270 [Novacetimonas maltaceti]
MLRHHETGHHDLRIMACALVTMFWGMTQALPAHAAAREDQASACKKDVFRLCFMDIPNEQLMEECLESKLDQLSPGCRAMFEEPDSTPPAAPARQDVQATAPEHASPPASP